MLQFSIRNASPNRERYLANGRVRDDEFIIGSCSDHGRIMLESSANVNDRFSRLWQISLRFWSAILRGRCSIS